MGDILWIVNSDQVECQYLHFFFNVMILYVVKAS